MKVLFVPTLNSVIAYYRMQQFVEKLRNHKDMEVAYSYHPLDYTDTCEWEWNVPQVIEEFDVMFQEADIAIFQSVHTQEAVAMIQLLKERHGIPILAEFDDDPYSVSSSHPNYDAIAPGSKTEIWQNAQIKRSSHLVVSTDYLKKTLSQRNPNVSIIPNALDFDMWDVLPEPEREPGIIKIGWAGGANHYEDLELIAQPIKEILAKHKHVRFVLFTGGETPEFFKNVEGVIYHDFRDWKPINKYPGFLKSLGFDIGLAPLRDSTFNRAKSNLKWLEYSALRIPTLASPVEPYLKTTAELVSGDQGWFDSLENLIKSESLRLQMGQASFETAKKQFDINVVYKKYLRLLKRLTK